MRLRMKYCLIITKYDECGIVLSITLNHARFFIMKVCTFDLSCLCKDNKGSCDDLVRISIIVQTYVILTQSHITVDEP